MYFAYFKSLTVNDSTANGGVISANQIINNQRNNVLPDVLLYEIVAGKVRYRKVFAVPEEPFISLNAFLKRPSLAMDKILIHAGSDDDTQAEADDYDLWKGSGILKEAIIAGLLTTFIVISENEGEGFNGGDYIRISDDTNEDFLRILSVTWDGYEATLECGIDSMIGNDYEAESYVSAIVERGSGETCPLWIKETIPINCLSYIDNISRIKFL
jgi:hypothetical protein